MERRKFTREFKLEAVKLIKDRGISYAQAEVAATQLREGFCGRSGTGFSRPGSD
jgi:transposase-like protein